MLEHLAGCMPFTRLDLGNGGLVDTGSPRQLTLAFKIPLNARQRYAGPVVQSVRFCHAYKMGGS